MTKSKLLCKNKFLRFESFSLTKIRIKLICCLHSELLIYIADSFACRFHDINTDFTAADLYTRGWTPYCSDFGIGYASTHTQILGYWMTYLIKIKTMNLLLLLHKYYFFFHLNVNSAGRLCLSWTCLLSPLLFLNTVSQVKQHTSYPI